MQLWLSLSSAPLFIIIMKMMMMMMVVMMMMMHDGDDVDDDDDDYKLVWVCNDHNHHLRTLSQNKFTKGFIHHSDYLA